MLHQFEVFVTVIDQPASAVPDSTSNCGLEHYLISWNQFCLTSGVAIHAKDGAARCFAIGQAV